MRAHLDAVGVIDLIIGAFFTALAVLVPLAVLVFAPAFNGAPPWKPGDAVAVVAVVSVVCAAFSVSGIPTLVAGWGLLKHRSWARILAIIVAVLAVTHFPIGTAVGLYTLWVLSQKETQQLFAAPV